MDFQILVFIILLFACFVMFKIMKRGSKREYHAPARSNGSNRAIVTERRDSARIPNSEKLTMEEFMAKFGQNNQTQQIKPKTDAVSERLNKLRVEFKVQEEQFEEAAEEKETPGIKFNPSENSMFIQIDSEVINVKHIVCISEDDEDYILLDGSHNSIDENANEKVETALKKLKTAGYNTFSLNSNHVVKENIQMLILPSEDEIDGLDEDDDVTVELKVSSESYSFDVELSKYREFVKWLEA